MHPFHVLVQGEFTYVYTKASIVKYILSVLESTQGCIGVRVENIPDRTHNKYDISFKCEGHQAIEISYRHVVPCSSVHATRQVTCALPTLHRA
jgi:hypothetical protein